MTYKVGDMISHPLHGAGVIDSIEVNKINGRQIEYYVMRLPVGDMCLKIPKDTCDIIGVRPIISPAEVERIFSAIPDIEISVNQNWNKRYRENMIRIRGGDLMEVAGVVKSLVLRDADKGLSNGERKMLHSAKQILISEIVLSVGSTYDEIENRLNAAMGG